MELSRNPGPLLFDGPGTVVAFGNTGNAALDSHTQQARQDAQNLDIALGPVTTGDTIVQADKPPPFSADMYGDLEDGLHAALE